MLFSAFDESSDVRSTQRKLDDKLVLLVKQKLGTDEYWLLPMAVHTEGETMRKVHCLLVFCDDVLIW